MIDLLPGQPETDGEPVFREPWEAHAFAMAVRLHERGLFTWPEWAATLADGTDKVKYFEGTPIPTSILLVGVLALATSYGAIRENLWLGEISLAGFTLHPLALTFAVSGSLMISRFHIPKL